MGYDERDDRRYDDELPPRRPRRDRTGRDEGDYGEPRSGTPSRPRSSRPRDEFDAPRSSTPSRPRSGDTPSRSRRAEYEEDVPPPRTSRPRDGYGDAGSPRSGTPSRSRASDAPRRSRDDGDAVPRGGARDAMRRVRDRLTGAYEAMSREVRGVGRRDDAGRNVTRSRRDELAPPTRSRDFAEDAGGFDAIPARPPRGAPSTSNPNAAAAALAAKSARSNSLAMRLINRRRRVRVGKVNPALRAVGNTALVMLALLIIVGGGTGVGYAYFVQQQNADKIAKLGLSRDLQASRIYDRNGILLYQAFSQDNGKRIYLDYCQIPEMVQVATIDTEDHTFYQNNGVDPNAVLRAISADVTKSGGLQGGSTITQQLVKLTITGASQNVGRKIDEAILALSVTSHYSKQDILDMYLNIVPYGYNNEGIEAAAESYFHHKPVVVDPNHPKNAIEKNFLSNYIPCMKDRGEQMPATITMSGAYQLRPWEALLLAGVPNNPNIDNPYANPLGALDRGNQVLADIQHDGDGKYFQQWDNGGNVVKQFATPQDFHDYMTQMLTRVDKNKNPVDIFANQYQGASAQSQELAPFFVQWVIGQLTNQFFPRKPDGFASAGWSVYTTLDYGDPTISTAQLATVSINNCQNCAQAGLLKTSDPTYNAKTNDWLHRIGLQQYAEYIVSRDITQNYPEYWYCGQAQNAIGGTGQPAALNPFANQNFCLEKPLNDPFHLVSDAALTAIDPRTGDLLAMVGGVDFNSTDQLHAGGQNNLATSQYRSMGSSFKPIVYATAFQMGWNPGSIVRDEPTCFPNTGTNGEQSTTDNFLCPGNYLPHNYTPSQWAGPQPVTYELGNSLNTPAEMALSYVGLRSDSTSNVSPLITMAQRLGITTLKPGNMGPSTAIGTQAVPLVQLTSAYGTFADQGYHMPYRSIISVTKSDGTYLRDQQGNELYNGAPQKGYQAISPEAAYQVTSILTNNTARSSDFGPDNPLHFPGRDMAAKTGTSDSVEDIVTMGYTPWLAMGVWAGNAGGNISMNQVIGITGAAYIFHDVMAFAIDQMNMPGTPPSRFATPIPGGYFPVPADMHRAILNCNTGLAPTKGMDVTNKKYFCNPTALDRIAPAMSTEFNYCQTPGKVSPPYPNETLKCSKAFYGQDDPGRDKAWDSWDCLGFGCANNNRIEDPGMGADIAWLVNGQDPTVP